MKLKLLLISFVVICIICSQCKNASNKLSSQNLPGSHLMDSIEQFFGNENWRVIKGTDTSYLLFSRQNKVSTKLYQYKILMGDSVNMTVSFINGSDDGIKWIQPNRQLILQKATNLELDWKTYDSSPIIFRHLTADSVLCTEGNKTIIFTKTITLSDFLVRSRYDYIHGTNYANDTVSFNWRKVQKDAEKKNIINNQ